MATSKLYYKVTTHDLRPPIQGGEPQWSGQLPLSLPKVRLDRSEADCGPGYHFCPKAEDALRLCGLWPNGRPSRLFVVDPEGDIVTRGDKARVGVLQIVRECDEAEVKDAVRRMGEPWFGPHLDAMTSAQMEWRQALGRPLRDAQKVEDGLRLALRTRGLGDWTTRRFDAAEDAWGAKWDAWDAWDARGARGAWGAWLHGPRRLRRSPKRAGVLPGENIGPPCKGFLT